MQKIKRSELFFLSIFLAYFVFVQKTIADSSNCDSLSGDAKNQCVELEKKAAIYADLIKLKNKQQNILSIQLDSINSEQKTTMTQLQQTQQQVQDLAQQIDGLEKEITEKEKLMDLQKKILSELVQSYYEYEQQGTLPVVMANKNFSAVFDQQDYLQQSGVKVSSLLNEISAVKKSLMDNQNVLNQKKAESDSAKNDLVNKKNDLQNSENQKTSLLIQTQGDAEKYKQMLAHIEAQKLQLFDFSAASNLNEIIGSVGNYPKPSSNLASTDWYFSQTDSRWGGNKIGNSKSLMKDWGCAVTSLAMVFREKGNSTDPGKLAKQQIFSGDLIDWPNSWDPGINLVSSVSHGNINWSTVNAQIKKGNPVIVYIKRSRGGGHYVVITGKDSNDYIVHDPYFGPNLYLGTSKALVGKLGASSTVSLDQMIVYN